MTERREDLRLDSDRQAVAGRLQAALTEGRLTLPENDDRLRRTFSAHTHGELDALSPTCPRSLRRPVPLPAARSAPADPFCPAARPAPAPLAAPAPRSLPARPVAGGPPAGCWRGGAAGSRRSCSAWRSG